MRVSHVLRAGSVIALAGLVACADQQSTSPSSPDARKFDAQEALKRSSGSDEVAAVSPALGRLNVRLAAAGSNLRIMKAEILYAAKGADEATSTLIFANNRVRGLIAEWVEGDERRDGRRGVTYAFDPVLQTTAFGLPNLPAIEVNGGASFRLSTQAELETYIEEGMQAWRDRKCSDTPIERVNVAPVTDPDQLDEFFLLGQGPSANYVQPADIVQAGWQPPAFFNNYTPPNGAQFILGVTFTFVFVDDQGTPDESDDVPTDVDGNGKLDAALREIYYNPFFIWTNQATSGFIDFFTIITHETGHALDLAHFGKVFVTKRDAADGIDPLTDVKYAPKALMNAVYVDGRTEILGTDNSSFCQIWASK
jgi:hypothetical protein